MKRHQNKSLAALAALSMIVITACNSGTSTSQSSERNAASSTSQTSEGDGATSTSPTSDPNAAASSTTVPSGGPASEGQPEFRAEPECGTYDGTGCAPESDRIDIEPPTFSNPTEITNPLFPISELESAVLLGVVDDLPFRSETTLLPSHWHRHH